MGTEVGTRHTLVLAKQEGPGWRYHLAAHLSGVWLVVDISVSQAPPGGEVGSLPQLPFGSRSAQGAISRLWVQSRRVHPGRQGGKGTRRRIRKCIGAMF